MSYDVELKSLNDAVGDLKSVCVDEMKKLRDGMADLQRQSALGPMTGKSADIEGFKSMLGHIRTGEAPLQYDIDAKSGAYVKSATVANPPTGGYTAAPEFQNRVIQRMYDRSPMRQICEVINVSSNLSILPYEVAPPTVKWVGETEKRKEDSDVNLGIAQIPVNECIVRTSISNTLLEDSNIIGVEDYLVRAASDAIERDVGDAFVSGDGFKKPEGLYTSNKLKTIKSGAATGVKTDALFNAITAIPNDALANARWTMRMSTFLDFVKAFGSDSNFATMPLSESIPASLLGYPVTFVNAPKDDTAGNICATFGDHRQAYKIVQRLGLQYQRDPFSGADDNMVVTRFRTRVGGQLVMPEAVVGIKVGA